MTVKNKDDLFYVCSLIEHIGRRTKNRRGIIVDALGEKGMHARTAVSVNELPLNSALTIY